MTQRQLYEQQLLHLKHDAKDPAAGVIAMSNHDLLTAINCYLDGFNCETWTDEELLRLESQLDFELQTSGI